MANFSDVVVSSLLSQRAIVVGQLKLLQFLSAADLQNQLAQIDANLKSIENDGTLTTKIVPTIPIKTAAIANADSIASVDAAKIK